MSTKVCLSLAALLFLAAVPGALAESEMELGSQEYKAGNFGQARKHFEAVVTAEPKNADAQYLLGNAFMELQKYTEATLHYRKAEELDPNGSAGKYSYAALAGLQQMREQAEAAAHPAPVIPNAPAAPNMDRVNEKTEAELARLNDQCDKEITEVKRNATDRVNRLKDDMQAQIDANGTKRYGHGRMYYDPSGANDAIKQDVQPQIDSINKDAERRVTEIKNLYKQRIDSVRNH
jgi:tetratricopeptide (TPR) repeat protein